MDLNNQVAVFRDHVMRIGKSNDNPETRDQIREIRRKCVELCETANEGLMPQIRSDVAEGIPVDSQHLVNLVCCSQLLLRELRKSYFLISAHPMDMAAYYEKRPRSSGVAVLDRLVLWKPPHHDYHKEELQSINRDSEGISSLLKEMKEFMPLETSVNSHKKNSSLLMLVPFSAHVPDKCIPKITSLLGQVAVRMYNITGLLYMVTVSLRAQYFHIGFENQFSGTYNNENDGKGLIEENKPKMDPKRNRALYRQLGEWCCLCKSNFG